MNTMRVHHGTRDTNTPTHSTTAAKIPYSSFVHDAAIAQITAMATAARVRTSSAATMPR